MLGQFLAGLLCFATDCDGTLCHYGPLPYDGNSTTNSLIELPASSGSGAVAFISKHTQELLEEIGTLTITACVSGMRRSTCLQRLPYLPGIQYWLLENGGLLLRRDEHGALEEIPGWRESKLTPAAVVDMAQTAELARSRGLKVDDRYETMLRVKGDEDELRTFSALLPASLGCTFNLGHLDIMYAGVGKLQALQWLLGERAFLYMGDDDNDIEALRTAETGFVVTPCSPAVREELRSWQGPRAPVEVPLEGVAATEAQLERVLRRLRENAASDS